MRVVRILLIVLAAVAAAAVGFVVWLRVPSQGFQKEAFVNLERGSGTRDIAATLEQSGVIRHSWEFLLARMLRPSTTLQAGEYRFNQPANVFDVFGRIARGDVYHFEFTVPEGSNTFDIARLLADQGILQENDFLKAAGNTAMIADLDTKAKSLEGYLFPSTYRMTHSTTAADLCRMMTQEFRKHWKQLSQGPREVHSVVTLASLVEKETGSAAERPLVASVFENRLSMGMKLECDPTTIYAALLDHRYNGVIHRSDLDSKNPYNTYQHEGLPPGPIANPGAGALEAALHPAETKYLFFVAKARGRRTPVSPAHWPSMSRQCANIEPGRSMKTSQPKTPRGRRTELAHWLETVKPEQVGEAEWDELRRQLAPVSESYLRKLLRESGVPLAPLVEGVRQETLEALESSLLRMLAEYEAGDRERKALVRKAVITAKDHAETGFAERRSSGGEGRDDSVDVDVAGESSAVSGLAAATQECLIWPEQLSRWIAKR